MANTIWKYEIPLKNADQHNMFELEMPKGASFLKAIYAPKEKGAFMWFEVYRENKNMKRKFEIVGTGHPIFHEIGTYLDSIFILTTETTFVYHIYEVLQEPKG